MNIKQIEKILKDADIEANEAKIEAKMLAKHFLGLSNVDLTISEELTGREDLLKKLFDAANLRAQTRKPIQHIIGYAYFMGEDFIVDENVLIPRDETEILVRNAISFLNSKPQTHQFKVLDIGTGSGCIACMLAKETNSCSLGVDISCEALNVAIENSSKLNLSDKVLFRKSDLFSDISGDEKFDLIISNPPYIPLSEEEKIQKEVKFDPKSALYAPDEKGVEFYKKIIEKAPLHLKNGGALMFELGVNQAEIVKEFMLAQNFKEIEIQKDLAGIERVIKGIMA